MNTARLRHSLLALSIAAATLHAGCAAADYHFDISSAPLNSNLLNTTNLVDVHGNLNATPVAAPGLTYGAQFMGLRARQLRNNDSIRIEGATNGVGFNIGASGAVATNITLGLINSGSIAVHGLTGSGSSTGISDVGSTLGSSVMNDGSINVSGSNASGVMLVHTNTSGFNNSGTGTINVSGTDAVGVLLDGVTVQSAMSNYGTIRATGSNAEALTLEGVSFTRSPSQSLTMLYNNGTISGESIGVHVSDQVVGGNPFRIYQLYGLIEGGTAAVQVDDGESYFDFVGGTVKGDLLGLSGVKIDGDAIFDGSLIKSGYVTIQEGTLTLVRPHTTIMGDFDMEEANSVLEMYLGNDTHPALPVLKVTGTTDIAPGAQLRLLARSSDFRVTPGGTRYTLISSGNLLGGSNLTGGTTFRKER